MEKNSVLIITDSAGHTADDSLFSMARHLAQNSLIDKVYVADRADPRNASFYHNLDLQFDAFHVRTVDDDFDFVREKSSGRAMTISSKDFDSVWIRMDHPVTNDFLSYLRKRLPDHFIVNDPEGLIRTMSKEFLPQLAPVLGDIMPVVKLCRTADDVESFARQFPDGIVLKQVLSYGGKGVVRYRSGSRDTDLCGMDDVAQYLKENGLCLAMEYLTPPVTQSDNRVVIMNGEVLCVVKRTPKEGGWLCNLTSGGSALNEEITDRERTLAARLDPIMRKNGIFLYGADMLLNAKGERVISEINTLNVGTMIESELMSGKPITRTIADALAREIAAMCKEKIAA